MSDSLIPDGAAQPDATVWRNAPVSAIGMSGHVTRQIEMSGCNTIGEVSDAIVGGDTFKLETHILANLKSELCKIAELGLREPLLPEETPVVVQSEDKPKRGRKPKDAAPSVDSQTVRTVKLVRGLIAKVPDGMIFTVLPYVAEITEALELVGGPEEFKKLVEALK